MTLRNEALAAVFVLLAARGGLATAADGVTVGDVSWTRTAASAVLANSVASIHAANPSAPAEVHAYVGGSDCRDDFRHVTLESGDFDDEGEMVRFGADSGWFFVTERRGGAASRVGRSAACTWAGADFARDLFDLGPLATDPPNYNRLENPLYPVPIRARRILPFTDLRLGRIATGVYAGGAE